MNTFLNLSFVSVTMLNSKSASKFYSFEGNLVEFLHVKPFLSEKL